MAELIQWNIRGLQANREELSLLISSFNPEIIALQETNVGINHNINYQNYSFYNCPGSVTNGVYHGGSALPTTTSPVSLSQQSLQLIVVGLQCSHTLEHSESK